MATRIFEIARKLGVTSTMVIEKCRTEGMEVKNHMTAVSAELEATIREWYRDARLEALERDLANTRKELAELCTGLSALGGMVLLRRTRP